LPGDFAQPEVVVGDVVDACAVDIRNKDLRQPTIAQHLDALLVAAVAVEPGFLDVEDFGVPAMALDPPDDLPLRLPLGRWTVGGEMLL
jgi:hypothetical protein